ncbi:MAG: hypothetical protein NTX17_08965 [Candidatus Eisenbacteria bacterium]|nr:hypothetical protein [Candidatus Eisenbacteria bacterium]
MKMLTKKHHLEIKTYFDSVDARIYTQKDIRQILASKRILWQLPGKIGVAEFLDHLIKNSELKKIVLNSPDYDKKYIRYAWREISAYQLSLSLRPHSYLSHRSAMYLNNLTELPSRIIYVNSEQTPKPRHETSLEQRLIDLAFKSEPRTSKYVFKHKNWRICCLSGLNTDNLGVVEIQAPTQGRLQVTGIERTLIDIAVRPFYSGGTGEVLKAYMKAIGKIDTDRLISILRKIEYIYPYHQVIGFYLQGAGFQNSSLNSFKEMGLKHDFYLDYGMQEKDYSKEWRVYFPKDLMTAR